MITPPATPSEATTSGVLRADVAGYVRAEIFNGRLRPGSKIDQDAVARVMGTSRIPVREALIVLEREGFVHWSAFRGTFVANLTEQDLRDHFALLGSAATLIARGLIERGSPSQRSAVAEAVERLLASDEQGVAECLAELRDALISAGISYRLAHEFESLTSSLPFWRFSSGQRHGKHWLSYADDTEARTRAYYHALGERVIGRLRKDGFWRTPAEKQEKAP